MDFQSSLKERNIIITDEMMQQLNFYSDYLIQYNQKVNLTAICEHDEIFDKHFYDSLLLADRKLEGTLVDVGSGAGFPGVVLKIAFPELEVLLLEPIKKRCIFLESLIEQLKLDKIKVINQRGEDYSILHRQEYDYVTARAVGNLNGLIEVCGAMVKRNGYFICLRGKNGHQELADAAIAIKTLGFEIESTKDEYLLGGDSRVISYLKKQKDTPIKYPRKYSIIKQHPL